jgi:hypothetical protein
MRAMFWWVSDARVCASRVNRASRSGSLANESATPPLVFREFFDQVRFGDRPDYRTAFLAWLHQQHRDRPMDVVVATEQQTLALLESDATTQDGIGALGARHGLADDWTRFRRRFLDDQP